MYSDKQREEISSLISKKYSGTKPTLLPDKQRIQIIFDSTQKATKLYDDFAESLRLQFEHFSKADIQSYRNHFIITQNYLDNFMLFLKKAPEPQLISVTEQEQIEPKESEFNPEEIAKQIKLMGGQDERGNYVAIESVKVGGQDRYGHDVAIKNAKVQFEKELNDSDNLWSINLTFDTEQEAAAFSRKFQSLSQCKQKQYITRKDKKRFIRANTPDYKKDFFNAIEKGAKDGPEHKKRTLTHLHKKAVTLCNQLKKEQKVLKICRGFLNLSSCGRLLNTILDSQIKRKINKINTLMWMQKCLNTNSGSRPTRLSSNNDKVLTSARKGFFWRKTSRTKKLLDKWEKAVPITKYIYTK